MRNQLFYDFTDNELVASFKHAKELCTQLNAMTTFDNNYRTTLQSLIPNIPDSSAICPPFHCDHGHGIVMGEHSFINYNCIILDSALVTIGNHVKIGPGCQLLTPEHPMDAIERREPKERALPITIGDDTWLGGGVIVCPGVTIGKRCIIAAGSVVTRDIPDECMAAGNPAQVKKVLER